jgi:tetratricopeptide (TPR) repeat protein
MRLNAWRIVGAVSGLSALLAGCGGQAAAPIVTSPAPIRPGLPPMPQLSSRVSPTSVKAAGTPLSVKMVEFMNNGQALQAIGAANRVIKNGGASVAKAYEVRGTAEGQMGEHGLAVQSFKKAVELNPRADQAWFSRAWYEYELGELDTAIKSGEKAIALNPKLSMAWLNLGLCYAVKNNVPKAQHCYEEGRRLADRGVVSEASRDIDNALERYPKSTKTLNQAMKWLTGE